MLRGKSDAGIVCTRVDQNAPSATAGADLKITVDVIDPSDVVKQYSNLDADDNPIKTLTVDVAAGDKVKINFGILPDDDNKIPEANIKVKASFS